MSVLNTRPTWFPCTRDVGCECPESATNSAMGRVKSLIKMAAANLALLAIVVLFIAFLNLIAYMWDIFAVWLIAFG